MGCSSRALTSPLVTAVGEERSARDVRVSQKCVVRLVDSSAYVMDDSAVRAFIHPFVVTSKKCRSDADLRPPLAGPSWTGRCSAMLSKSLRPVAHDYTAALANHNTTRPVALWDV
jgi:hypothetical protein